MASLREERDDDDKLDDPVFFSLSFGFYFLTSRYQESFIAVKCTIL